MLLAISRCCSRPQPQLRPRTPAGPNGCGKSTLLKSIAAREFPIPEHLDIYLLNEGAPPTELGALDWVVKEAEAELERLDRQAEQLLEEEGPESPVLVDLYDVGCPHFTLSQLPSAFFSPQKQANTTRSTWTRWTPPPSLPVPP